MISVSVSPFCLHRKCLEGFSFGGFIALFSSSPFEALECVMTVVSRRCHKTLLTWWSQHPSALISLSHTHTHSLSLSLSLSLTHTHTHTHANQQHEEKTDKPSSYHSKPSFWYGPFSTQRRFNWNQKLWVFRRYLPGWPLKPNSGVHTIKSCRGSVFSY